MSGRGRPKTDPNKVVDSLYKAIESISDKGLQTEAEAIRYYLKWQGKTRRETLKIHQEVVAELMRQLEEYESAAGKKETP